MRTFKLRKSWFTLVEVMLVTSIFAIVVVWIILAINRAFVFIDNTRLSVRAANFAREWMEMMYNIRDTNWRQHSWNRDKFWLNAGNWECNGNWSNIFSEWIYVLKEGEWDNGNKCLYASGLANISSSTIDPYEIDWFFSDAYKTQRENAKLTFDWEYKYYERDEENREEKLVDHNSIQDVLIWKWLEFYRIVRVFGVYCKNSSTSNDKSCSDDSDPKEMRFCVKVFYASQWKHATELCGIITNFKE